MDITPTMLNYQTHADNGSMFNTPPCYTIYIAGLTFKWIKKMGGLEKIKEINEKKAKILTISLIILSSLRARLFPRTVL